MKYALMVRLPFLRTGIDRRVYPRAPTHNLVKLSCLNSPLKNKIWNLINISEGGIALSCRDAVTPGFANAGAYANWICPGAILDMVINLVEENRLVAAMGHVVWVKPPRGGSQAFHAGVCFSQIGEGDRTLVRHFVGNCLNYS